MSVLGDLIIGVLSGFGGGMSVLIMINLYYALVKNEVLYRFVYPRGIKRGVLTQ